MSLTRVGLHMNNADPTLHVSVEGGCPLSVTDPVFLLKV